MEAAQLALRGRAYLPESPVQRFMWNLEQNAHAFIILNKRNKCQGGEYSRNADDDSGKSGITPKIFDVVIGRRDNDEERQLGDNES